MVITQNPSSPVHENAINSIVIVHFYDIMPALLSAQQGALMGLGRLYGLQKSAEKKRAHFFVA